MDDEDARREYLARIQRDPGDVEALTALGHLAFRTRYRSAARTAFARAAQVAPGNPVFRVNLANALLDAEDLQAARIEYEAALSADPGFAPAHQGLSYVFSRIGDEAASRRHRDLGFRDHWLTRLPYLGSDTPLRILVLASAAGGNFNTDWMLDPHRYEVVRIASEYAPDDRALPPHDVVVNAIGDADLCALALAAACRLRARSQAPCVNDPVHVAPTGRQANAERLAAIAGAIVPKMAQVRRSGLLAAGERALRDRGFGFPLLLRTLGHNTGRHFEKVEDPRELAGILARLPGDDLLALEYRDLAGPDGLVRKYRMMAVDQVLYPAHLAVSSHWKVHLFSASGADEHRAEDARFLADPQGVLGAEIMATLGAIVRALRLDYAGVDFGVDASGRLVLFEANATMSIPPVDPDDRVAYRKPAIEQIVGAFEAMLERRAR